MSKGMDFAGCVALGAGTPPLMLPAREIESDYANSRSTVSRSRSIANGLRM